MKNLQKACDDLAMAVSAIQKAMTEYKGEKIDGPQDGNISNANEEGEVEYSQFDNEAKKKIVKQKMLAGG
jgi:hypothetical protein